MKNDVVEATIPAKPNFTSTRKTCWDDFYFQNDIVEIRHNGGDDGVSIKVNLINQGVSTKLLFGSNADIDWIILDSDQNDGNYGDDGNWCLSSNEAAYAVKIQNGQIIQSQCVQ